MSNRPPTFKTFEDVARWCFEHDAGHRVFEDELRRKVGDDMKGAIATVEKLVGPEGPVRQSLDAQDRRLGAQDAMLATIERETKRQTKHLRGLRAGQKRSDEERIARKAIEEETRKKAAEREAAEKKLRRRVAWAVGLLVAIAGAYATVKGHP